MMLSHRCHRTTTGLAVLLGGTALSGAAMAQATTPPPSSAGAQLEELVVTAQRRSESVQDVPAAITALSGEALAGRGIDDMSTLQFAVPNLTLGQSLGTTQIAIRGVGRSTAGAPAVAVNIDGVYQPRNPTMVLAQADLDRVEVLRGPQGTLYGRNANAGAINFLSVAPKADFGGQISASYATYDEYHLQAVLNTPIGDRVRTRLVVDRNRRGDGFVKNIAGGEDLNTLSTSAARLRVSIDLAPNLTNDIAFSAIHASGKTDYYVPSTPPNATGLALNPYIISAIIPSKKNRTSALGVTGSDRNIEQISNTLAWQGEKIQAKSITAFQRYDNQFDMDRDGVDLKIVESHADEHATTFSQEFNVGGTLGPVDWVGGAYYARDKISIVTFYAFPLGFAPLPPNFFLVQDMPEAKTVSRAAFADATFKITERLKLIGGLRYSRDDIDVVHANYVGSLLTGATAIVTCPRQVDDLKYDGVTYRAGAQFEINDNVNTFATVSKGFKAGGVNTSGCNNAFSPEFIKSYEAGFKSELLNRTLRLNASAFWYDYTDFQLTQVVGIAGRITNAASARVKGVEVEANWSPVEHWSLNANASILDAKFLDFISIDSLNPSRGAQNVRGNHLPNAPKFSGGLGAQYMTGARDWGQLTVRGDVAYRSKLYFREFNDPAERQSAYAVVDANIVWDAPNDVYSVRLFATNLFNKGYYTAMLAVDGFGSRDGSFGAPRQIGAELKARF